MEATDDIVRGRLFKAIEASYRNLYPFRQLNRSLVEEYAGSGYGQTGKTRRDDPLNLLNQAVDAYTMCLVANRPRVMVSTDNLALTPFAKRYEIAINNLIEDIGLEYTLRQWVLDAFFCIGIIKVHMADAGEVLFQEDRWIDPGTPFASNVSLDNFVYDLSATNYRQVKYAGDMYRIPFEDLKSGMYDLEAVEDLTPTTKYGIDAERLERITRGSEVDFDEFQPMVDLADIWIPTEGKIYTYAVDSVLQFKLKGKPLACLDWNGPEFGPYKLLGFNDVSDNVMPTSPASHLWPLHKTVNNLLRKQARRAKSQKINHTFTPAGAEGAKKLQRAADDEWVQVQDTKEIGMVVQGGIDAATQGFLVNQIELFDRGAGNLTAMLGLGAQAETAAQEELIHGAVSKKEASMQYRVVDGTAKLIRDLGHMLWADKFKVIPGIEHYGSQGDYVDRTWRPEVRKGRFEDYEFAIDVYSMPYSSPQQKVTALNQLLTQIYAPMANLLMQQGGSYNLQELTDIYADLLRLPQLKRVVQFSSPPDDASASGGGGLDDRNTPLPATSTRQYVRKNVPTGGTAQSRSHVQQQAWLNGGSNNQDQTASLARPAA